MTFHTFLQFEEPHPNMISNLIVYVAVVFLIATTSLTSTQHIVTYGECTMPNGVRASCIHLEQCTFLYNMLLNPQLKSEDRLFLRRSQCGINNGKVLICCPAEYIGEQQPQCGSLLPDPGTCGRMRTSDARICTYGGSATKIDDSPWMALISYHNGGGIVRHYCGGSLINNRYVLTAAHCIKSTVIPETWTPTRVRLGEWDTSTDRDCEKGICADPHVDVTIEKVITHPNYTSSSKNQLHDIALLRLLRCVNYTDFIRPICLPIKDSLRRISFDGMSMVIAGWGLTEKGIASNLKLKATVPGIPLSDCQLLYGGRYFQVQLENSQICAGGQDGVDSCDGDSGGALVALDASFKSPVYYIAGVISFGPIPCGLKGWPGVYTKVSSYIDWIQQNIEP